MEKVDAVVIGAGVIGLAVARALALAGRETIILEKETTIGTGTSSRNSEVIHAGIYYPKDSLKARLCVAGRKALYAYCDDHGVPYRRCGKLIVAIGEQQRGALERVLATARGNGVHDITPISREEARALEPALACSGALLSPSTGIIDSHAYMLALLGDAQAHGAIIAYGSTVAGGRVDGDGLVIDVLSDGTVMSLAPRLLVNCAGLEAQAIAGSIAGLSAETIPPLRYAKGNYFQLLGRAPFTRLIYPVPEPGGLGVHITIDLGGQAKFGPDVEWTERLDYTVDPARATRFYAAIRQYWPGLPDEALVPGYAGIRPKLTANGGEGPDFVIQGKDAHGIAGLINLYGIESPGLTSSLAMGDYVKHLAEANLT
ncbi:MAG: NAD(P)/FAD-dependent oxidoreductase [Hyphomicrobiales bacterium]|nr:NAD(P)/FAD-dependent oxidoreductase [Hyphomicrobiales bacterium]